MYTYPWYHWIAFFYIYCFFGWIFESAYVSLKKRQFINRGFLRLPMLPLYGTGAVMMLWVSLPVKNHPILVYFAGVAAATALEYATGYMMERLFKMKYWDYSNQKFQIHGYICLTSSIAWGFLTIFLTEVIHKPVADFVLRMNPFVEAFLLIIISIVFVADTIQSTREALTLGHTLEAMTKMKGQLDEMQLQLALLKVEASQKLEDVKHDIHLQTAELKADARIHMKELKTSAWTHVEELKSETASLAAEFRNNISRQNITDLKEEAASQELSPEIQSPNHTMEKIRLLSERTQKLLDSRRKLSAQMSFYRKGLLKGNPSASSKKFAEALEELRNMLEH